MPHECACQIPVSGFAIDTLADIIRFLPSPSYIADNTGTLLAHNRLFHDLFPRAALEQSPPLSKLFLEWCFPDSMDVRPLTCITEDPSSPRTLIDRVSLLPEDTSLHNSPFCIGILEHSTALSELRRIVDQLPVGIFALDQHDRPTFANLAALSMLDLSNTEAVGNLNDLYEQQDDFRSLARDLRRSKVLHRRLVPFRTPAGSRLFSVSAARIECTMGSYAGSVGTLEPATRSEQYAPLLNDVPLGLYIVETRGAEEIITHCNRYFAKMLGAASVEDVVGTPARTLHTNEHEHKRFMAELLERAEQHRPLRGFHTTGRAINGAEFPIEISALVRVDSQGQRIGRVGAIQPINDAHSLRHELYQFAHNASTAYHVIGTTLTTTSFAIQPLVRFLHPIGRNDSAPLPSPQAFWTAVTASRAELVGAARRFIALVEQRIAAQHPSLHEPLFDDLLEMKRLSDWIDIDLSSIPMAHRPDSLQTAASALGAAALPLRDLLRRTESRNLILAIDRVLRACYAYSLLKMKQALSETSLEIRSITERLTTNFRFSDAREKVPFTLLLRDALNEVDAFAKSRGVALRFAAPTEPVAHSIVRVARRDFVRRVLVNLLHNAVKYSWERSAGEAWVSIDLETTDQRVLLSIQNWGVPIQADELESGKIFELGYRGILSHDRSRQGTGIGLTDALRVTQDHHGTLTIKSVPADHWGSESDYTKPFLTTVFISLPRQIKG